MELESLVDAFLDSYAEHGGINHIDGINLPSKASIANILENLLHLLMPGFWGDTMENTDGLPQYTRNQLKTIVTQLSAEIEKSLEFAPVAGVRTPEVVYAFFTRLLSLRPILQKDAEAAFNGDPAATCIEEVILAYPGFEALAVYRIAHILYELRVPLIPRMMTEWAHGRTGVDIHPGARIGTSFFMDHGTGIVIGETCIIGDRVKIYHGVTLGARSTSGGQRLRGVQRHPIIEDDVTIYPGATILGGDTRIGARSVIGGNVWLTHSVPPDSLVTFHTPELLIRSRREEAITWEI
ncbi:MAG: serine O-acetyltransferase [Methylacidiphilales bacterium]|nr:serine O-acetyltransferase [Candidatus Methylacidiphilales bacterium]MDW8349664.1 serine O-acetyltransferase EpsC [Verrucomicrobiae bacterium]